MMKDLEITLRQQNFCSSKIKFLLRAASIQDSLKHFSIFFFISCSICSRFRSALKLTNLYSLDDLVSPRKLFHVQQLFIIERLNLSTKTEISRIFVEYFPAKLENQFNQRREKNYVVICYTCCYVII